MVKRKNSIKSRFSPTMISKFHSQREIEFVKSILPITTFLKQLHLYYLMKNPELHNPVYLGVINNNNYGFENTKAKVLNRDSYTSNIVKIKRKILSLKFIILFIVAKGVGMKKITLSLYPSMLIYIGKFH